jgi:hypothetical protein
VSDWEIDEEALNVEIPNGFHSDKLGQFNTQSYTNSLATYRKYPNFWRLVSRINTAQEELLGQLFNATPVLSAFLIHRAHSAYLGAVRLTVSTQVLDAYPLMRSGLEYGLYAVYFKENPKLGEVWQKRHESKDARKKVRNELKIGKLIAHLKNKDRRLKATVEMLYGSTIDFGGHPNVYGVAGGLEIDDNPEKEVILFQNNTLVGDTPIFHLCRFHTAAVGVSILEMMCLVFPERARIIGVTDTTRDLKQELTHFSRALNKYFKTNM